MNRNLPHQGFLWIVLASVASFSVACGSGPVISGRVESSSVSRPLAVSMNGSTETVEVDRVGSFIVYRVPTGDVTFTVNNGNASGKIVINQIEADEQIRILVKDNGSTIEVIIEERIRPKHHHPKDKDDDRDDDD